MQSLGFHGTFAELCEEEFAKKLIQ
jgi:long-chain acyl-CoA synthetase